MPDALLRQLTPSQRKAVLHIKGPLLVIAGPGSGKTRVITYRITALINLGIRPQNICAITFTNKAADEMRQRVLDLSIPPGTHISTFHSLCVRILRQYPDKARIRPNFSVYDDSDQARCIKQAVKDCQLDSKNFSPARMLDAISALKNNLVDFDSFKANADDFFSKILSGIYIRYQSILTERNALDFDDLLMKTAFLLRDCPDVRTELGNRFKFLLIDEYQDTNHAQYIIAKELVSQHNNICATGDPDQSIYRWRGADIRNILDFQNDWPDATIVKLEENFRSTPNILNIADKLIAHNKNRKQKKLVPTKPAGKEIVISTLEDENQEAQAVANQIKDLTEKGASLKDIAVFYRINAQSRLLEEAFIRNKIPYQVVRGIEFYNRKEIRDLLAYLKILVNPNDEIALLRIINTPARGIGKTTIDRIRAYAFLQNITLFNALKKAQNIDSLPKASKAKLSVFVNMIESFKKDAKGPALPIAQRVLIESGLFDSLKTAGDQNALENLNELLNAAHEYDQQAQEPSLLDFLQQIALFSDVDAYDTSKGCVALMTLHCAKGLEFENVFIIGVEQGLLPHEKSNTDDEDELEEERRLFFVGITRAKAGLHINYARYRTIRGQLLRTIPSQFLFELETGFTEPTSCQEQPPSCHSCAIYPQGSRNLYHYDNDSQIIPDLAPGRLIRHESFGIGIIEDFVDMGENSIVVIKFKSGQTKSLMLKYANLSIIENF